MAYSELIKNFDNIRSYMRDFFIYGFKTRDEYDKKSARSYDNERRRIQSYLGDLVSFNQNASGKNMFISLDGRSATHNPLYQAFKINKKAIISAKRRKLLMINKLHLAMIELYRGDAKRIQHFCKVHSYAKLIAETENVDKKCLFTIEAAALTHDIGIHFCEEKYGNCNGKLQKQEGPAIAERLLEKLGFEQEISDRVQYLIAHHHTYNDINEIDYQILVEADFLVNIREDGLSKEVALKAYHNIFKTACGKTICREMFNI